ncbi:hypothetical protein JKP88DRAFT_347202 [Tribonema minus]|uniref:Uncharacterized protein n=1 Tax=Tribonema minus TaxID=303371 RepID=A0A836C835_9STRA|nr:hypothetical protein JKP88DRAFT_347202 [Tribonema minus]
MKLPEDAGGDTELCGEALQSGQQVSLCNIVGKGYPLGSAADLLFAARFQKPDAAWPTTDRNVRAFMADYTLTLTREQSRLDAYKQIKGTAESRLDAYKQIKGTAELRLATYKQIKGTAELDMFLCSDLECTVVAGLLDIFLCSDLKCTIIAGLLDIFLCSDLECTVLDIFLCSDLECTAVADLIFLAHGPSHAAVTLAMGYVRFATTVLGLPMQFIRDAYAMTPVIAPIAESDASVAPSMAQVAWTLDDPQWVEADPVLVSFGAMDLFNALRMGNYETSGGKCVTIITFKHDWMDQQGWNTSHDCVSKSLYIFDSYFTQANLQWPPTIEPGPPNKDPPEEHHVFAPARRGAGAGNWDTAAAGAPGVVASYGRTLFCDASMFRNVQTVTAGTSSCSIADGAYAAAQPAGGAPRRAGRREPRPPAALVIGAAAISAWAVTEERLTPDSGGDSAGGDSGRLRMEPYDYLTTDGGRNPARGRAVEGSSVNNVGPAEALLRLGSSVNNVGPAEALLRLAVLASKTWTEPLPWCNGDRASGTVLINSNAQFGELQLPNGTRTTIYDCDAWGGLGWGPVGGGALPAVSGATLLARMRVSWVNMTYDFKGETHGIMGYARPFGSSILSGINTTMASARTVLSDVVSAELATTDTNYTRAGAFLLLSQTLVALLAAYLGRHELVYFFRRARLPRLAAKALTAVVFVFTIVTPPALVLVADGSARATGADGSSSTIRWVEGQAYGSGEYRIVGAVSVTLNAQHDQVANVLVWLNFTIALVGCLWCSVAMFVRNRPRQLDVDDDPVKCDSDDIEVEVMQTSQVTHPQQRSRRLIHVGEEEGAGGTGAMWLH